MQRRKNMKIYLQIVGNKIAAVYGESNTLYTEIVSAANIDEFYSKINKYAELDEEVEEQVKVLFDNESTDKSISTYNIKHWVSNRSFGELIDMYQNNEIIKPDMQREFVWDSQKSSRLIESIVLGLPIPPLFLMEVGKNQYELIDGFQRITTVVNYVTGKPWVGEVEGKKSTPAKLSGDITKELQGRTFEKLDSEHKRIIRRSTIPLIEFKQMDPDDLSSKYLIFERINTGSEKLNQMQIRKSLAHGSFINSLYEQSNNCNKLINLFSVAAIKKDAHVEAFLRIYAMTEIVYRDANISKSGLNNILNAFCESYRNKVLPDDYYDKVNNALLLMEQIFEDKKFMFKRVEKDENGDYHYVGTKNISIMEALLGVAIENNLSVESANIINIRYNYKTIMADIVKRAIEGKEENPFSTSTGTKNAIENRFKYAERILGVIR